ncbi:MAG: hypothetical protein V1859_05055 [archaeon]
MIKYDVLIIGAGPAGLAAANEFVPYLGKLKIALFDKASFFGGSGGNTDNKWNILRSDATESVTGFWHLIDDQGGVWSRPYIEAMTYAGAEKMEKLLSGSKNESDLGKPEWYEYDPEVYHFWNEISKTHGLTFEKLVQFHIGSIRGREVMQRWGRQLQSAGIDTQLNNEILSVENSSDPDNRFKILAKKGVYFVRNVIIAKGRSKVEYNEDLLVKLSKSLGFDIVTNPIDIGVRIEFLPKAMRAVTTWHTASGEERSGIYDPKFRFKSARGDWIRTFCSNVKGGRLSLEKLNGLPIVNGESDPKWYGQPANTALLDTISLREPNANAIDWAMRQLFDFDQLTSLPGETSRVMIQRLGDFLGPSFYSLNPWIINYENGIAHPPIVFPPVNVWKYRRSRFSPGYHNSFNREGFFKTTLETKDGTLLGTPGDFHMAFNGRICDNLRDTILALGALFPGILHPSTVLAGPEIKMYAVRGVADGFSQTKVKGLYVAGDGGRGTHGIAPSFVNGMNAAHGILLSFGHSPTFKSRGKEYTVSPELVGANASKMI